MIYIVIDAEKTKPDYCILREATDTTHVISLTCPLIKTPASALSTR